MSSDMMGEVITIDNFTTRMCSFPPLEVDQPSLYGLVDMGSNGIRFSVSDLSPPRSRLLHCVYRERAGISLYDALHEQQPDSKPFYFSSSIISKVSQTLGRFRSICDSHGVPKSHVQVFATEAMRTAKNRDEMLSAIKEASGLTVDILSPGIESLFGAMGARSGYSHVDGLFMDLGGGSVQMTYVNSTAEEDYDMLSAEAARSMPFGAAKLTQALSSEASAQETKDELRLTMKTRFEALTQKFPQLKDQAESTDGVTIYFCGGGFRGYGSMLMHTDPIQPYPIPAIGGYTVLGHRFIKWREMLHANNYEEGKIFGMSKRRREQFPAIVTVVQSLVEAIPKIKQVIFCSGGNREGVLYMKLPPQTRESHPIPLLPAGVVVQEEEMVHSIAGVVISGLVEGYPGIFTNEILHYIARNIWRHMGDSDDTNSSKALQTPISGLIAGLPGMSHETRAILSLIMAARWGSDLGPLELKLRNNLRSLVGQELGWWCDYIGALCRLLAIVMPKFPLTIDSLKETVSYEAVSSHGLGRKSHKVGIRLKISLSELAKKGLDVALLESLFEKVGKGLHLGWKIEAEVVE